MQIQAQLPQIPVQTLMQRNDIQLDLKRLEKVAEDLKSREEELKQLLQIEG